MSSSTIWTFTRTPRPSGGSRAIRRCISITPTHASWANLIECFFSILGEQGLSHRVDRSKKSLREFLLEYLATYNETSRPFTWTRGPEQLQSIIERPTAINKDTRRSVAEGFSPAASTWSRSTQRPLENTIG